MDEEPIFKISTRYMRASAAAEAFNSTASKLHASTCDRQSNQMVDVGMAMGLNVGGSPHHLCGVCAEDVLTQCNIIVEDYDDAKEFTSDLTADQVAHVKSAVEKLRTHFHGEEKEADDSSPTPEGDSPEASEDEDSTEEDDAEGGEGDEGEEDGEGDESDGGEGDADEEEEKKEEAEEEKEKNPPGTKKTRDRDVSGKEEKESTLRRSTRRKN